MGLDLARILTSSKPLFSNGRPDWDRHRLPGETAAVVVLLFLPFFGLRSDEGDEPTVLRGVGVKKREGRAGRVRSLCLTT